MVGSASVLGLLAKPIVDLAVGLADEQTLAPVEAGLCGAGWIYRGDTGRNGGHLFVLETRPWHRVAHLHVVKWGGHQWQNYVRFRDLQPLGQQTFQDAPGHRARLVPGRSLRQERGIPQPGEILDSGPQNVFDQIGHAPSPFPGGIPNVSEGYGLHVDNTPWRIDRVDVRETEDDLTLILGAAGLDVMLLRMRYDGRLDEVINNVGAVASGPGAWTLIGHELSLEFGSRAAATLGFPRDCRLHLDVDDQAIRRVRTALLEILECACFVVDIADGRLAS